MNSLTARSGWNWIVTGLGLFRKRPFFLTNLFFAYLISLVLLSLIPVIGQILPVLMAPVFTLLFMQACYTIDIDQQSSFRDLFSVLNRTVMFRLIMAGACYLLFALLATGLAFLVDGGSLFVLISQGAKEEFTSSQLGRMFLALGLVFIVYVPFAMAMWFAAPLIGWKDMSLGKALFYSFFSIVRAYKPFLVYVICWIGLGFLLPYAVGGVLGMAFGQSVATFVIFILSIMLSVWMYCSFYPTYRDIFERPDSSQ
ncbi:BPSS1780 family membrane protein [Oxalobacter paraformigenes]|uniref:Transmembrane protein n=1 Tax=Oxalobacter paraformigenes TaxID=556268 RepID=C3X5Y6_9BURK|nr:BPSS1780 family membrane protein [Oxalobacter paraformigenes]EEO28622.1 hypothetical protein OFAG_01775 [Oxalobacter paraformigenes]